MGFEMLYIYTRKQAIEDGVLIDVTETSRDTGFRYPVVLTKVVWDNIITPDNESKSNGQSKEGRLWDLLWMCLLAARKSNGSEIHFRVMMVYEGNKKRLVRLKALCHPGDDAEPVITIMLPEED